ncbi:MAG: glycosyltransferase family 1 protein [Lachnospiraceae bacterium]|nr:glycosyltransferase family 1 protein [Lachnospiraceae bacterium]
MDELFCGKGCLREVMWRMERNKRKKKIVVLLDTDPTWGGEHQYALTLMECVKKADRNIEFQAVCGNRFWRQWCREHQIKIWDVSWPLLTEKEQRLHIKYPLYSRVYAMYMTQFGKRLNEERIDAVLCTTQGIFIPNIKPKVIAPVHDLMHRYEGRFPEVREGYENRELLFSSKAKYAWCVLTDSGLGKRQFAESYAAYIRKKVPHIVSLPYVVPKHILEIEEEFTDAPKKYVFYPAQFWQHKNHINLVKAIKILAAEVKDIHLVLVGSEKNNKKKIQKYIAEEKLEDYVTMKGFVSNGSLVYLYRHAVGMIMPSYFGPTNIPPLEAMALGCPVAVSNKYAMPEQVGAAGLLFNPDSPEEIAECIRKLWIDEALRQKMIKKGYRRIEKWTQEAFNNQFQKIINRV